MLSIADQIQGLTRVQQPKPFGGDPELAKAVYRDRVLTTWEFVQVQGTVSAARVAEKFKVHLDTAREHLRVLMTEGKITKFMVKGRTWYTVARPKPRENEDDQSERL